MATRALVRARDWLAASDPDLGRARGAARAALTAALATAAMWTAGRAMGQPLRAAVPGVQHAIIATVSIADTTARAQRVTAMLAPAVGAAGIAAGALAAPLGWLGRVAFLALIFVAVLVRRFGPRGVALGTVAYLGFFIALFYRMTAAQLPWVVASCAVSGAIAVAVRFTLLPDREPRLLARSLRALLRAAALTLDAAADERARAGRPRRRRAALDRLNRVALAVEEHLAAAPDDGGREPAAAREARAAVFDLELETGAVATLATAADVADMRAAAAHLRALATGRATQRRRRARSQIDASLDALLSAAGALAHVDPARASRHPDRAPRAPHPPERHGLAPATRVAVQATLACGLAMLAGALLSPARWYWAVIGAFVVFVRTETLGETLWRGWHRLAGTAAGVVIGLHLARAVRGHAAIELAAMLVLLFVAYYFVRAVYGWPSSRSRC